jgi:DNA-directed RNA polymerase I, II, and III subunit RPABC5
MSVIPIKCFTCGGCIADKYQFYLREVRKRKIAKNMEVDKVIYLTKTYTDKTPEGDVLDLLKMKKMCCRRHFITHVDIE